LHLIRASKTDCQTKELLSGNTQIDWAFAEALAFGTILFEVDQLIKRTRQRTRTFSQRHLILTDMNTEEEITPHNSIAENQAKLEALDSLLSEAAVLGFEFGYSIADPLALVIWSSIR